MGKWQPPQLVVQDVLNSMEPVDREIIVLQHFEELTIGETAKVLGIKRSTASMRYIAALKRLKQPEKAKKEIAAINERVGKWMYRIVDSKLDYYRKVLKDLLEDGKEPSS